MFAAVGILVVVVIVVIAAAAGGSSPSLKDTRVPLAEGSSGVVTTAGKVTNKITIEKITDPASSTNQFERPAAGKHYIRIALTIENVGTKETTGGDFLLRTTDGFEYKQAFISGVGATDLAFLQNLTSGGKLSAVIAFEVADGSIIQWLKFDPNPFAKGDLYFDK